MSQQPFALADGKAELISHLRKTVPAVGQKCSENKVLGGEGGRERPYLVRLELQQGRAVHAAFAEVFQTWALRQAGGGGPGDGLVRGPLPHRGSSGQHAAKGAIAAACYGSAGCGSACCGSAWRCCASGCQLDDSATAAGAAAGVCRRWLRRRLRLRLRLWISNARSVE